jgi:hypothetical protein
MMFRESKWISDLTAPLHAIIEWLKNLLPVVEDHVYHPEFPGSFSIKKVLPALVPDLSYVGLYVADGDTSIPVSDRGSKNQCRFK